MKFAIQLMAGVAVLMATEFTLAYYAAGGAHAVLYAQAATSKQTAQAGRLHQ